MVYLLQEIRIGPLSLTSTLSDSASRIKSIHNPEGNRSLYDLSNSFESLA